MAFELTKGDFAQATSVFVQLYHHLAVTSILQGKTSARILVDDLHQPRSAATWTGHRLYIAGSSTNPKFNESLTEILSTIYTPQSSTGRPSKFIVYYEPFEWETILDRLWKVDTSRMMRLYYEAPIKSKPWDSSIPKGFTLERITKELLEKKLKKMDRVRAEMNSERNTIKEFLEKSFGYVAITNGEVACWCMSEYDSEDSFEVGIETVEKYRRRGLATATATALI